MRYFILLILFSCHRYTVKEVLRHDTIRINLPAESIVVAADTIRDTIYRQGSLSIQTWKEAGKQYIKCQKEEQEHKVEVVLKDKIVERVKVETRRMTPWWMWVVMGGMGFIILCLVFKL